MEAPRAFPPSPVFSDSDSLAGIDDLDAFLDSKGELSRWPTPPSRRWLEEDLEVPSEESDYDSEDGVDGMYEMDFLSCGLNGTSANLSQISTLPLFSPAN